MAFFSSYLFDIYLSSEIVGTIENVSIDSLLIVKVREATKKVLLLMAGPLRRGRVKGRAIKEKRTFSQRSKISTDKARKGRGVRP